MTGRRALARAGATAGSALATLLVAAGHAAAAPDPGTAAGVPGLSSTGNAVTGGAGMMAGGLQNVVMLALISLAPFMLVMMTAFTRIVVVLSLTRSALGTQNLPPTPVVIGLSLFLTAFVMAGPFKQINSAALQPWLNGKLTNGQFFDLASGPLRHFMLANVRERDLALMVKLSHSPRPATPADIDLSTLVPAYVISELRTAFLIGFVIFIPFLVIDLVVSAVLSSAGMMMLPPAMISLPFKLLLFVVADGWYLIVESLLHSFGAPPG